VAAAPVAEKQMIARTPPPPQPNVMAPLPVVEARSVSPSQSSPLPPIQVAVTPAAKSQPNANTPTITSQTIQITKSQTIKSQSSESQNSKSQTKSQSSKSQTIALDSLSPPASVMVTVPVNSAKTAPSGRSSPPEPKAVAATPAVETQIVARASVPPPLSNVAAPSVIASSVIAPSVTEGKTAAASHLLPPPNTAAAAPLLEKEKLEKEKAEKAKQTVTLATAVLPSRPPAQISTAKALSPAAPAAGMNVAIRGALLPVPDEAAAASAVKSATVPNGPTVTYRDGQLTIDAQNSTLAEVLKMVAEKSGAKIEVPPGSGLERIYEHAGPGPAQDVLVGLLNGSPYDFIIVSSPQTPNTPAQVLLTLRGAEPAPSAPSAAQPVFSAAAQPRPSADPYLWTPPNSTQLISGDSSPVIPHPPAVAPPAEPLSPDVLEQKLKDFNRQLRGGPPPSQ
jgi:hypothetical protein